MSNRLAKIEEVNDMAAMARLSENSDFKVYVEKVLKATNRNIDRLLRKSQGDVFMWDQGAGQMIDEQLDLINDAKERYAKMVALKNKKTGPF